MKYIELNVKKEYAVKLNKGDNIKTSLGEFMQNEQITFAKMSGIGAVVNLELGLYKDGAYINQKFDGMWDIISMDGNMALLEGKPMYHIHMTLGSMAEATYGQTISGHFMNADIAVVGEIFVTSFDKAIERVFDEPSKMKLWDI